MQQHLVVQLVLGRELPLLMLPVFMKPAEEACLDVVAELGKYGRVLDSKLQVRQLAHALLMLAVAIELFGKIAREHLVSRQMDLLHVSSEVVAYSLERHIDDVALVSVRESWERRQLSELLAMLVGIPPGLMRCREVLAREQHRS